LDSLNTLVVDTSLVQETTHRREVYYIIQTRNNGMYSLLNGM